MSLLLIYVAIVTPYRVAFIEEEEGMAWFTTDLMIDCLFFADVLVNCFLAYYDKDKHVITNKKQIFIAYLKGWMLFDLLACLPLQLILSTNKDYSSLLRVARLPRLYRIIKMAKLMRMLKLVKNRG